MKIFYQLITLFFLLNTNVYCQSIVCPPNIDFENGNYGYWKFYTGTCCPISVVPSTQINNRHFLTNGSVIDAIGGFPIVAPGGDSYSLKLGNTSTGAQAERASYTVHVPQSANNFSLIYRFAVVFEAPGHSSSEQPRFEVSTFDSNTNTSISCNNFSYVASSNLPGFTCNGGICFRGWATASLNLTGYNGHTIIVNFSTGDCSQGGHFGYGYVDLSCSLFQISSNQCNTSGNQSLNAPPGFQQYIWYDSNYVNTIAQGANIVVPTPLVSTKYNVVLIPFPGYGCSDTLTSIINVSNSNSQTIYDTICNNSNKYIYTNSGIYVDTFTNVNGCDSIVYLHLFIKSISTSIQNKSICQGENYLGHTLTGSYIDTLMNYVGCDSIISLNLVVNPTQSYTLTQQICEKDTFWGYYNSGVFIDTFVNQYGCDSIRKIYLTIKPLSYTTINKEICFGDTYLGYSFSGTYKDTFQNYLGCDSIRTINLTILPFIDSIYSISICEGDSYMGYSNTGVYIDTFINSKGCDSVRQLFLYIKPKTYFTINKTICERDSYLGYNLSGFYIDTFVNYQGCDSIRYLNLNVIKQFIKDTIIELCVGKSYFAEGIMQTTNGNYTDTFLNINNCDSIINTALFFKQKLFPRISGDSLLCAGDTSILFVGNFNLYNWSTLETTKYITVKSEGEYSIIVKDKDGCVGKDTIEVEMNPLPNVSIQFTQKDLCKFDTIQLTAVGANNYNWYSPNQSRLIGNINPIDFSIFTTPVNVILKGVDANDCINYDSVILYYINCCGSIYVPNAFSPNGDGHNDKFKPISNKIKYEGYELKIFNRFGQMIFQTNDMQNGWDGTFKNNQCDIGTYYYLIKTKCFENNENKILNGDINLIR